MAAVQVGEDGTIYVLARTTSAMLLLRILRRLESPRDSSSIQARWRAALARDASSKVYVAFRDYHMVKT
jgi:hypothetical protein